MIDSCISLFTAAGCPVRSTGESQSLAPPADGMAAFVGITSAQIRGGFGLVMPSALLSRIHPVIRSCVDSGRANLPDWLCELTNQLTGRIKNKLLPYGVAFRVSMPPAMVGKDLRLPASQRGTSRILTFEGAGRTFFVHFTAETRPARSCGTSP